MDRTTLIQHAKLSEKAERYDDMAECMTQVVQGGKELSNDERNLLYVSYKNVTGARRSAWRVLSSTEQESKADDKTRLIIKEYREKVESELRDICNNVLGLLSTYLIKRSTNPESKVFYLKMKGDYYRYLAEIASDEGLEKVAIINDSESAYQKGFDISKTEMPQIHPVRLGLALNFSVFYYEIQKNPDKAINLAKKALEEAVEELDTLDEESYKDSITIIELLKDNLVVWTSDNEEEQ